MPRTGADIEGLVRYLITSLVAAPEAVEVTSVVDEGVATFSVRVDPEDVGKIIGRGGRIIKSIRTLARAAGSTEGLHIEVEVAE